MKGRGGVFKMARGDIVVLAATALEDVIVVATAGTQVEVLVKR